MVRRRPPHEVLPSRRRLADGVRAQVIRCDGVHRCHPAERANWARRLATVTRQRLLEPHLDAADVARAGTAWSSSRCFRARHARTSARSRGTNGLAAQVRCRKPMTIKDLEILYAYDDWANNRLFDVLTHIAPDEFTRPVAGSYGSIR